MHWCFNVVAEPKDIGAAALIRAVVPVAGIDAMRQRRQRPGAKPLRDTDLCSGPAKLTQAMDIRAEDNCVMVPSAARSLDELLADASDGPRIAQIEDIAESVSLERAAVAVGPRIGISMATELPWRYGLTSAGRFLSKPF
jgi:DNA-3-methyladenine glycosylase